MNCKCGKDIPAERLEALPDTTTCLSCSTVGKVASVEVATGKDCEVQFVSPEVAKKVEGMQRNFLGY